MTEADESDGSLQSSVNSSEYGSSNDIDDALDFTCTVDPSSTLEPYMYEPVESGTESDQEANDSTDSGPPNEERLLDTAFDSCHVAIIMYYSIIFLDFRFL